MKTKHTPGPWKHDNQRDTIYCAHESMMNSLICKIATGENRKEEDANASLISAAPELLEACRNALAVFGNDLHCGNKFFEGENSAIARLRMAVDKATVLQ